MNTKKNQDAPAQGAETPINVDLEQVKKWLRHDVSVSITCLNAIQSDPDLMDHIARFMFGRLQNQQNRQQAIFDKDNSVK